ncbi:HD domain-containing protein [Vibrio owensii]|uniref:HD domain-containing protein n=1 Tax=Vibrio harveyi group TaxID=717610 RepID=UPI003CC6145E
MNTTDYDKLKTSLKNQLRGMALIDSRYELPLKALSYAETVHTGFRKCGKIPTFYHQLSLLGWLMSIHKLLERPWMVYTAAILHDVAEDHPEEIEKMRKLFGDEVVNHSKTLSKNQDGNQIPYEIYFEQISQCPVCSIVKLADRIHNLSTMQIPFSLEKQQAYIADVTNWFMPMLRKARAMHLQQVSAYEVAKSTLNLLCNAIGHNLELQ